MINPLQVTIDLRAEPAPCHWMVWATTDTYRTPLFIHQRLKSTTVWAVMWTRTIDDPQVFILIVRCRNLVRHSLSFQYATSQVCLYCALFCKDRQVPGCNVEGTVEKGTGGSSFPRAGSCQPIKNGFGHMWYSRLPLRAARKRMEDGRAIFFWKNTAIKEHDSIAPAIAPGKAIQGPA